MKKSIIVIFLLFVSTKVLATPPVFGEIYLGSDNSKLAATKLIAPNEDGSNSGLVAGVRGGYKYSIFMLGVDAMGTAGYMTYGNSSLKNGYWNKTATYVMAGFDFGRFRLWGDYGVINQTQLLLDYNTYKTDKLYMGGTSYKFGAGVKLGSRLSVNAEYYVNRPDKMQNNAGLINFNGTYSKFEETGYIVTLSYLFNDSEVIRK